MVPAEEWLEHCRGVDVQRDEHAPGAWQPEQLRTGESEQPPEAAHRPPLAELVERFLGQLVLVDLDVVVAERLAAHPLPSAIGDHLLEVLGVEHVGVHRHPQRRREPGRQRVVLAVPVGPPPPVGVGRVVGEAHHLLHHRDQEAGTLRGLTVGREGLPGDAGQRLAGQALQPAEIPAVCLRLSPFRALVPSPGLLANFVPGLTVTPCASKSSP